MLTAFGAGGGAVLQAAGGQPAAAGPAHLRRLRRPRRLHRRPLPGAPATRMMRCEKI